MSQLTDWELLVKGQYQQVLGLGHQSKGPATRAQAETSSGKLLIRIKLQDHGRSNAAQIQLGVELFVGELDK